MSKQKMSPDELSACRKQLEHVWKSRIVDEGLLHQAWHAAHEVAALLYEQFGATQVAVFGSLTEPTWFTKGSDIDIAVSGLSNDAYNKARIAIMNFDSEFKIDIVNLDMSKGLFRERVKHQAIPIKREGRQVLWRTLYEHLQRQVFPTEDGEIYEMNRKRLTQRINDELGKISETLERIQRGLENIDVLPAQAREFIENTIATDLANVYRGIENIFLRIAREVDMHVPRGSRWHTFNSKFLACKLRQKDLLTQMTEQHPERPPVISENTSLRLEDLLDFRHKVNNIYGEELIYEMTEPHAKSINALFTSVSEGLGIFTDLLAKQEGNA